MRSTCAPVDTVGLGDAATPLPGSTSSRAKCPCPQGPGKTGETFCQWYVPRSFESYCEERFGFKASYVRQLRAAASIASVLWDDRCNCNGIPAKAEGTLRPLTKLLDKRGQDEVAPEQRDRIEAAWARAGKLAEDEGGVSVARPECFGPSGCAEQAGDLPKSWIVTRPAR